MRYLEFYQEVPKGVLIPSKDMSNKDNVVLDKEDAKFKNNANIEDIIDLFVNDNIEVSPDAILNISPTALHRYREYDRNPSSGWTGKKTSEEYEEQKKYIKKNGIQKPLVFELKRLDRFNTKATLKNGNHRNRIANELGLSSVPVRFKYK